MNDFRTFLSHLAEVLQFTALSPDKYGACLVVMKENNIPLLFEFDDHLIPNTILMSTPIADLDQGYERQYLNQTLKGNREHEETLSLKPDEDLIYLHRRLSPQIHAKELKLLIDQFLERTLHWKNSFAMIIRDNPRDRPNEPPSLKPHRFKV